MRGSVRCQEVLAVPADRAWSAFTRPELLHHFFPGLVECRVEDDLRTVTLATGITMAERILTNDAIARRFQYRIEGGLFRDHLATVDVFALDDATCLVSYATDADPSTMAIVLGGAMQAALDELRHRLESGAGPLVDALALADPGPAAPIPSGGR
jgi:hypothetical protein